MSARDDFPALASLACTRGVTRDSADLQASWALDRIDALEAELVALRVGGVAERAVLDAADEWQRNRNGVARGYDFHFDKLLDASVCAWRGAAPTAEETP